MVIISKILLQFFLYPIIFLQRSPRGRTKASLQNDDDDDDDDDDIILPQNKNRRS